MNKLQDWLQAHLGPLAAKLNKSDVIRTITTGMMGTMPISLGVSILAILIYLPIPAWQTFLSNSGLQEAGVEVLTVTLNLLAIYMVVSISKAYAGIKKISATNSIILALGTFMILCPLNVIKGDYSNSYTISTTYLGSSGIFLAMVIGIFIPFLYSHLMKHVGIKLPDSIPPMVTDSLSPTFCAMILFGGAFLVRWVFSLTPFGNLFDFVNIFVAGPVMKLGASPAGLLIAYWFSTLLWFFGIHPAAILGVYGSAIGIAIASNAQAFLTGQPLPYLHFQVIYNLLGMGGSGILIGLALSILTAKSQRYKSLSKLSFIPALFNISEPVMFGFPVVMNPLFFIPFILAVPVCGGISWLLAVAGLGNSLNPVIQTPWAMPSVVTCFLQGGWKYALLCLIITGVSTVLYYPFFRMADNQALNEEQAASAKEAAEAK